MSLLAAFAEPSFSLISTILSLLQVLGALGVFIYGMKVMSEGVQRVADAKLRAALSGITHASPLEA